MIRNIRLQTLIYFCLFFLSPFLWLQAYHLPIDCHPISAIDNKACLAIEAGCFFTIPTDMQINIRQWAVDDIITISPNHTLLSGQFIITNLNLNQYVGADLLKDGTQDNEHSWKVLDVNPYLSEVTIHNTNAQEIKWLVSTSDASTLVYWKPEHTILVGRNDSWIGHLFSTAPSILINVDCNDYVKAERM